MKTATTNSCTTLGQSLWLDNITRTMLDDGTLAGYIDELSVTGLTSNPTIFDKAISGGDAYDEQIAADGPRRRLDRGALLRAGDRRPARRRRPLRARSTSAPTASTASCSLEVSPLLADDTAATIEQAARAARQGRARQPLHQDPRHRGRAAGDRGVDLRRHPDQRHPALLDASSTSAAADAYMRGIERRIEAGLDPDVASVASLFISRWDVAVARRGAGRAAQPARHRGRPAAPTAPTASCSTPSAGSACSTRAPARSGCSGRAPGPRTPTPPTSSTSRRSPRRSPSTRCPSTTLHAFADHGDGRRAAARPTAATPRRCWPSSARPGSTSTRSPPGSRRRASRASSSPGTTCSRSIESEREQLA